MINQTVHEVTPCIHLLGDGQDVGAGYRHSDKPM